MNTPTPTRIAIDFSTEIDFTAGDPPEGPIIETEPPTPPTHGPGARSCPEIARALFADPPEEPDPPPWGDSPRACSTCGATMIPAGKRAFICPNQRDQGNGISAGLRAAVKTTAASRDLIVAPF